MKIFLDTANLAEIEEISGWGIVDGVTTNPSLLAKEKGDPREILYKICEIVKGPVSAEVVSQDTTSMVREARELVKIHKEIVVKIPCITEGIKALKVLAGDGIKTNATLIFSPLQALIVAKSGATFVSPFVGRLDDIASFGMEVVEDIMGIFLNYDLKVQVIVASIRNPLHMLEAAKMGAHIATVPPQILRQAIIHPLTDIGLARFLADWEKACEAQPKFRHFPGSS